MGHRIININTGTDFYHSQHEKALTELLLKFHPPGQQIAAAKSDEQNAE